MITFDEALGATVREARNRAGFTTTSLANELRNATGEGWTRQKITRIETAARSVSAAELVLLAVTFGTTANELLPIVDGEVDVAGAHVDISGARINGPEDSEKALDQALQDHAQRVREIVKGANR